jgi:hypothetical protein
VPRRCQVTQAKIELGHSVTLLGSFFEPWNRKFRIGVTSAAIQDHRSEIIHGVGVPGFGRFLIPVHGSFEILGNAIAFTEASSHLELRGDVTVFGGSEQLFDRARKFLHGHIPSALLLI